MQMNVVDLASGDDAPRRGVGSPPRMGGRPLRRGRIREKPRCVVSAGGMPGCSLHAWGGGMLDERKGAAAARRFRARPCPAGGGFLGCCSLAVGRGTAMPPPHPPAA